MRLAITCLLLASCATFGHENSVCPLHRKKPDARCIKFHCPQGHDYETKNEPLP